MVESSPGVTGSAGERRVRGNSVFGKSSGDRMSSGSDKFVLETGVECGDYAINFEGRKPLPFLVRKD